MTTTFEKYAGTRRGNYCTLPVNDVEILPDVHHCICGRVAVFGTSDHQHSYDWYHEDGIADHYVQILTNCRYCHSEEHAVYIQYPYYDATECSRCGGVDGYAIGD